MELLIATVCLAGASIGILSALRFSSDNLSVCRQRSIALQLVKSEIEKQRGAASSGTITASSATQNLINSGIPATVSLTTTVTRVGTTALFDVSTSASWTASTYWGSQDQTIRLDTRVRFLDGA